MYYPFFVFEGVNILRAFIDWKLEREIVFNMAKKESERLGLPLVNYGCKDKDPFVSQSDLNLDIVFRDVPNFELIESDGRIPLHDNSGVVFASHVLEHVNDPEMVLNEMMRVGPTFIVLPKWWSIGNWVNPRHKWIITKQGLVENPSRYTIPLVSGLNLLALIV